MITKLGDIYCFGDNVRVEETTIPIQKVEGEDPVHEWRVYKLETQEDEDGDEREVFGLVSSHDTMDEALAAASAL